jgi:uncharacterized protein YegP (UPF0339 family)
LRESIEVGCTTEISFSLQESWSYAKRTEISNTKEHCAIKLWEETSFRFNRKILATSISYMYTKKYNAIKRIASLKVKLRETFGLLGFSIEETQTKLDRIV